MEADFTRLGRAYSGVSELWGSSRELVVLGSCSTGVQHSLSQGWEQLAGPLRTQGSLPQGSLIGRTTWGWRQMLHGWAKLVLAFLGCSPFPGGWQCWVLVHGGVAPPGGRQARANGEASPPGWQAVSGPVSEPGVGGGGVHWETQLSDS